MLSAVFVAHAGMRLAWTSTETRQMRQLPTMGSLGYQQRVGISMPAVRAASRIVWSGVAVMDRPSIRSCGIVLITTSICDSCKGLAYQNERAGISRPRFRFDASTSDFRIDR